MNINVLDSGGSFTADNVCVCVFCALTWRCASDASLASKPINLVACLGAYTSQLFVINRRKSVEQCLDGVELTLFGLMVCVSLSFSLMVLLANHNRLEPSAHRRRTAPNVASQQRGVIVKYYAATITSMAMLFVFQPVVRVPIDGLNCVPGCFDLCVVDFFFIFGGKRPGKIFTHSSQ